jgi:Tol biopolymer transport system component
VLFTSDDGLTRENLWMVRADGSEAPEQVLASPYSEEAASFSPDGRYLAFTSDESGRPEVYVQAIDGTRLVGGRVQVSSGGGTEPAWRRDGRELYYAGDGRDATLAALDRRCSLQNPSWPPAIALTSRLTGPPARWPPGA